MTPDYDVIVVGGGPAGATVASVVAMRGHRVLLLEREQMPRYQIGESLLPSTVHGICQIVGVYNDIVAADFIRKNGTALRWGTSPEIWTYGFSQAPLLERLNVNFAYQVERSRFDKLLLDNARKKGVIVQELATAQSLAVGDKRISGVQYRDRYGVERNASARYVVDASGHRSRLYKYAGHRTHSQFFRNLAMFGYFESAGRLPSPNEGNILCEAFDNGWMWFIPLTSSPRYLTSVGVVVDRESMRRFGPDPEKSFYAAIGKCPKISDLLKMARRVTEGTYSGLRTRRDWTYTNERFWIPGLLLVGDAACFLDPVLSTGVHLATYSGLLGGRSINSVLSASLDEQRAFDEFEYRYRLEYSIYLNYLFAFYDMNQDEESYYWSARKVLSTQERANEAFVRLVSGSATAPDLYFHAKEGIGQVLQDFADEFNVNLSRDVRNQKSRVMTQRIHRFQNKSEGGSLVRPGGEDLRRMSWGKSLDNAVDVVHEPGTVVPAPDGLSWELK